MFSLLLLAPSPTIPPALESALGTGQPRRDVLCRGAACSWALASLGPFALPGAVPAAAEWIKAPEASLCTLFLSHHTSLWLKGQGSAECSAGRRWQNPAWKPKTRSLPSSASTQDHAHLSP